MHLSCFYVNQFVAPVVYFIPSMHPAPNTLEKKNTYHKYMVTAIS